MKFVCTVCGYVHEGDAAPEKCPVCKVPPYKFDEFASSAFTVHIKIKAESFCGKITGFISDFF